MAKLKYYHPNEEIDLSKDAKTIKTIVGEDYLNDYKARQEEKKRIAQKEHEALIKAKETNLLAETKKED